jgi:hypothetical protein
MSDILNQLPDAVFPAEGQLAQAQVQDPGPSLDSLPDLESPLSQAYRESAKMDPARAAQVMDLAKKINEPEAFVDRNLPELQKAVSAPSSAFWQEYEREHPEAAKFLMDRRNMVVAQDDFDNLGKLESYIKQMSTGLRKGNLEARQAELWAERLAETRKSGVLSSKFDAELQSLSKELEPFAMLDEKVGKGFHPLYQFSAQVPNMTRSLFKFGAGESLSDLPGPALVRGAQGAAAGAAAGAAVGAATGSIALAPGVAIGAGALASTGAANGGRVGAVAGLAEYAYQLEAGNAFREYSAARDVSGASINPQVAADAAHTVGMVNAALETAGDLLLMKVLKPVGKLAGGMASDAAVKALTKIKVPGAEKIASAIAARPEHFAGMTLGKAVREAGKLWALGMVGEISTEFAQEVSTGIGAESAKASSGQTFADGKGMAQILDDATGVIYPTFQAMLIPSGLGGGARVALSVREIKRAEQTKEIYTALGASAEASKVRGRLPEVHRQFVEQVTKGSPVENIFIPAQAFETYFQSKKLDPKEAAAELGVGEDFETARETGGDLKIPLSVFTEKVAGTEHHHGLADDVKFSQETLSVNEAKQTKADAEARVEAEFAKLVEAAPEHEKQQQEYDTLKARVRSEIESAKPREMLPDDEKEYHQQLDAQAELIAKITAIEAFRRSQNGDQVTATQLYDAQRIQWQNEGGALSSSLPSRTLFQKRQDGLSFVKNDEVDQTEHELPMSVAVTTNDQVQPIDIKAPNPALEKVLTARTKRGRYLNEHTKISITVNEDSIGKVLSQGAKFIKRKSDTAFREHLQTLQSIDALVKNAVYLTTKSEKKGRTTEQWLYFFAPLKEGNVESLVKLQVKKEGEKYTLHNIARVRESGRGRAKTLVGQEANSIPAGPLDLLEFSSRVKAARETYTFFQDDQDDAYGRIQFGPNGPIVTLFRKAHASTPVHEFAHAYLKDVFDYVRSHPEKLSADYQAHWKLIVDYLGIEEGQTALTEEQQERFAHGFDDYLQKGEAPSEALKQVFTRFRRWLTAIYRRVKQENLPIDPRAKAIFDRMLATEDEIQAAEASAGRAKLQDKVEGLTEAEVKRLSKLQERAHEEAISLLMRRQLEELKEERKEFLVLKRTEAEKEAKQKTAALPIYKIQDELKRRMKTSQSARSIAQAYSKGKLTEERQVQFELHAELSGYSSGDHLAKAILDSERFSDVVAQRVREEMATYADLKDTSALREEALKAIHNERSYELMALESEILESLVKGEETRAEAKARRVEEAKIEAAAIKARAKELMWKLNVRGATAHGPLITSERRAAEGAAKALAKKDFERAAALKRQQMLNHALAQESLKIKAKVEKWTDYLKDLRSRHLEAFKKEEHFYQAAEILSHLGMGRNDYDPTRRTESLRQWAERMEAQTNILNIPDWVFEEGKIRDHKELTVSELQDVINTLKNIMKVANFEDRALVIAEGATMEDIKTRLRMEFALSQRGKEPRAQRIGAATPVDRIKRMGSKYLLSLIRVQNLLRGMQGFRENGAFTEVLEKPVDAAADHESKLMVWATEGLKKAFSIYSAKEQQELLNRQVYHPELGSSVPRMTLIMMALNLGNEDNKTKLFGTKPVGVPEEMEWNDIVGMGLLQRGLTEKDWEFVQSVWDLIGERWEDISSLHRRMTGFAPGKVAAVPFNVRLSDGKVLTLKGGYFPLKQDPRGNRKANLREALDTPLYTEQNPGWKAVTKTGHTKERTGAQYAVSLDHSIIFRHLRDVIHDIAFREVVTDLRRLVASEEVAAMVVQAHGEDGYQILNEWVNSVAVGQASNVTDVFGQAIAELRKRTTAAILTWRISNIVQNFANVALYANAAEGFGQKEVFSAMLGRGLPYWANFFVNQAEHQVMKNFVFERSAFMRDKHSNPDFSFAELQGSVFRERGPMREILAEKLGQDSKVVEALDLAADKHEAIQEFGKGLAAGTDEATSIPIWVHAYNLALDRNFEHEEAVQYADSVIKNSIGSGRKYDAPSIQRGGETAKLVSMFMTFLNAEFNRWYLEAGKATVGSRGAIRAAGKLAMSPRFLGFLASRIIIFNVASLLISGKGPDEGEDELKWWLKQAVFYPISFFPGVRDVADVALDQLFGLRSFGYRPSAAGAGINAAVDFGKSATKWSEGSEEFSRVAESFTKLMSFAAPYPDQFNAWLWNAHDYVTDGMKPAPQDLYRRRPKKER